MIYKPGDSVKYITVKCICNDGVKGGITKTGVIEEAFKTLNNEPCYWICGEKELILHDQIVGKA